MISDKERRAVAARLRADHRRDRETQGTFIARMVKGGAINALDVCRLPERLADLIDRPTCHDVGNGDYFICSECGCEVTLVDLYGEPVIEVDGVAETPHYCPWCGGEVVSEDAE